MKLDRLLSVPSTECVLPGPSDAEFTTGFTSDLLSDVMGHASEGAVLMTIQAHKNTIAVATLVGIPAILVCTSRPVPEDMKSAAEQEGIAIYRTALDQYQASVALHALLSEGGEA